MRCVIPELDLVDDRGGGERLSGDWGEREGVEDSPARGREAGGGRGLARLFLSNQVVRSRRCCLELIQLALVSYLASRMHTLTEPCAVVIHLYAGA